MWDIMYYYLLVYLENFNLWNVCYFGFYEVVFMGVKEVIKGDNWFGKSVFVFCLSLFRFDSS